MSSALERRLIVVSGKGGVGKTTVSAAVGLLGARRGLRTIVVEVTGGGESNEAGGVGRLAALLGQAELPAHGVETELREGLWSLAIDRDRVLAEWLRAIGGRVPARVLTSSSSFQYLIAAAPGAREMLTMVKLWELAESRRPADRAAGAARRGHERDYDLVVFDAPATGHALAMLRSPHTFGAIARVGPIARQARQVRELVEDPERSAYLAVTHATEMGVSETLDLREGLRHELGRELDALVVNGALPRRFAAGELRRIAAFDDRAAAGEIDATVRKPDAGGGASGAVTRSAARAAWAVHERARAQQRQLARLRREGIDVVSVPFAFKAELALADVERIARRLDAALSRSRGRKGGAGVRRAGCSDPQRG
ncbi:MAG TPA: ArsA family ATPase [Solirubrobacteraceae bacterium]|nr:ArsA family ATPase [Solirubrobacteraceae bacterium]